jgi:hypothetical protein
MRPYCCVFVYPPTINFWMLKPLFMELGTYIMVPEPISTMYFITPLISWCVCMCSLQIVARQWPWRHVPAAINMCNNRSTVGGVYMAYVISKENLWVCLCTLLSLLWPSIAADLPDCRVKGFSGLVEHRGLRHN